MTTEESLALLKEMSADSDTLVSSEAQRYLKQRGANSYR